MLEFINSVSNNASDFGNVIPQGDYYTEELEEYEDDDYE